MWLRKSDIRASRMLGWTSLLIGMTEFLFPKKIEQTLGVQPGSKTGTLRVLGIREMATGFDILAHRNPRPGIFARVAGDLIDVPSSPRLPRIAVTKWASPPSSASSPPLSSPTSSSPEDSCIPPNPHRQAGAEALRGNARQTPPLRLDNSKPPTPPRVPCF